MGFLNKLFGIKSGMCGGNLRWELFLGTLTISGTGKIERFAFDGFESLTSVIIGNSVTSIGNDVFRGCTSLTSVTIGNSVTSIGNGAFFSCIKLTNVTIPDSVMMIDNYAFSSCFRLTSVTIGNSVTRIGNGAFIGCARLTSVTIPESVTTIGDEAFYNCTSLKEIHYPAGRGFEKQLSQGNNAKLVPYTVALPTVTKPITQFVKQLITKFVDKRTIQSANKPTTQPAKSGTQPTTQPSKSGTQPTTQPSKSGTCGKNLRWKLDGSGTLTISGTGEMDDYYVDAKIAWRPSKESIKRVVIADGVTSIGVSAFYGCISLTSVKIPDSVTTIGDYAFSICESLTSVTIPDSVTSIGNSAFRGCGLTSVTIPDSVTSIGNSAFNWCTHLTSVTIPDSVTSIGGFAFDHCENLTSVTIPDSVTSIGNSAFSWCESLTSVTIPDSVTSIGDLAFGDCTSLKEIHYPAGRGFEKNLSQFNNAKLIPYNVTSPVTKPTVQTAKSGTQPTTQPAKSGTCGKNLRWKLDGSGTLTISGTGEMDDYYRGAKIEWLSSKESIKRVVIVDGVTSIGNWAFRGCEKLTSVTIPDSVTSIGNWAFGCEKLTSVTIPDSVTSIGNGTFNGCKSLASVTIGNSVTSIGNGAFRGCKSLASVTIGNSVTSIGNETFNGCTSLKEIHYPAGHGFEKQLSMGNNAKLIPYTVTPPVTKPTVQPATKPTPQPANKPTTPQLKFYLADVQPKKPVAEKLTWSFAGKTLTVGDVREIKFFPYSKLPWLKHLHDIQRIVVGEGVEKIAAQAFEECKRLELVTLPASVKTIGDMFASVAFCGDRFVNGGRNVFWCLEDGVLVLKKNPAAVGDDFSTGFASWIFADKNIRGVKLEPGIKPTEKFFAWLSSHDGAAISFG